ncbi:MAG: ribosomal-protein-alanine N-acetyltransferase [Acidobacteria bacterium]|nr:ribosomal-protein-alanine N-acetyltransferase [Acidobacteriota bacterium]
MVANVERASLRRDIDGLVELETLSFQRPWSRQMLIDELSKVSVSEAFVVRINQDSLVGYCSWRLIEGELYLNNLAIHPEHRRQGLARLLLMHLTQDATSRGVRSIMLEVRSSNAAALKLYWRMGFKRVGMRPDYYTNPVEDAVLLSKSLAQNC